MKNLQNMSVIGIDGGGTGCRFALLQCGRRTDVVLDAANVSSDPEGAMATLHAGLGLLAEQADMTVSELRSIPAFLGLAGALDRAAVMRVAKDLPLEQVWIEDDRRTALEGALGPHEGCVIGVGTGSFFGRRSRDGDRLVGGWGFVLGDEASGAALGRQLLRTTLMACDGLGAATALTRACLEELDGPAGIVSFASTAKPNAFAALAPRIVASAKAGDPVAEALLQAGANHIEDTLKRLGWSAGERICPIGGLAPHYAPYLSPNVAAQVQPPMGTALDGALTLAARMAVEGKLA